MTSRIYLDNNATVPLRPSVREAVVAALEITGNPSSVHSFGRDARRIVEEAREQVAGALGTRPGQVILTGGGTEANIMVLRGFPGRRILVSAIEHDSVLKAVDSPVLIPVRPDGTVSLEVLQEMLAEGSGAALVSVMLANNETGVIQPLDRVVEMACRYGALVHTDAVQAVGKMPVDFSALGVDLLSVSAHKVGGPPGVGALVVRDGLDIEPLLRGGGQERRRRAGTENVPGIAGFGEAMAALDSLCPPDMALWRDRMESEILKQEPRVRICGRESLRLPNTSCLLVPGIPASKQLMALDLEGIAVSAGSACSSGKLQASHVLRAMGLSEADASCAIRISAGWQTVPDHLDRFVEAWTSMVRRCHIS
ncbi:MAG: cysteine desulfurase [Pseudomonadota bacterium]|nr:cysteine desulfurase [Pseudomonadota bacterium]